MDQSIAKTEGASAPRDTTPANFLNGFLPEEEYARHRGVTVRTCQRARQLRKAPPYIKLGRRIFYRVDAVREWLLKNERADQPDWSSRRRSRRRS